MAGARQVGPPNPQNCPSAEGELELGSEARSGGLGPCPQGLSKRVGFFPCRPTAGSKQARAEAQGFLRQSDNVSSASFPWSKHVAGQPKLKEWDADSSS